MTYYLLTILFLLFLGAMSSATFAEKEDRTNRPKIYWNESFLQLINLSLWPVIILATVLLIMNWKLSLIIIIFAVILQKILLKPISEKLLIYPLYILLIKKK